MNSFVFGFAVVVVCLTTTTLSAPLSTLTAASSNDDVTTSNSQSEMSGGDTTWTGRTTVSILRVDDVEEERDMQTDDSDAESDSESGVLTHGQQCMMMLAYTMIQTNVTFRSMCRLAKEDHTDNVEEFCAEFYHMAIVAVSPLPRLQNLTLHLHKKTVYTYLLAGYNITFQYTHIISNISGAMLCGTCDANTRCADVSSEAPEDVRRYCEVHNLLQKFHSLLNCVGQMMLKLHGSLPTLHAVSFPSHQDPTAQSDFDLAVLAMAATQLAEVKNLMEQDVMVEL